MRTKQVFPNSEIPHLWAHQKQESARNPQGNFYFHGKEIFSYGSHFCIARLLDNGKVLFTNRTYNNTIAKHIGAVRYAVSHLEVIKVAFPEDDIKRNLFDFQDQIKANIDFINSPRKREATKNQARQNLKLIVANIEAYIQAVGATPKQIKKELAGDYKEFYAYFDAARNEQAQAQLTAILDKIEQQRQKAEEKKRAKLFEIAKVEQTKWRNGKKNNWRQYDHLDLPVVLRVDKHQEISNDGVTKTFSDTIQTSRGASVSYDAGKLLYQMIKAGKDIVGHKIDGYTVISLNGVLTVGCHKIERKEIERLAKKEGW